MRVLLSFPSVNLKAGVERVVRETANHMLAQGHDVTVLAGSIDAGVLDPKVQQIEVGLAPKSQVSLAYYAKALRKRAHDLPPFDVHGAFSTASPPGGVLWVQAVHREWIAISRRTRGLVGRLKQLFNPFHRVALRLEREVIGGRHYGKLIALTPTIACELQKHYRVPPQDICVLPNGFNSSEFRIRARQERESIRRNLGVPCGKKIVLFVANETQRKGFEPLLRAIARQTVKPTLLAVGNLGGYHQWGRLIDNLSLRQHVVFTGPTQNAQDCFSIADVFVLPTIYEAWGLVIVEALASGVPVLTSKLAGAAVAIQHGHNGYLLDQPHSVEEIDKWLSKLLKGEHCQAADIARSVDMYDWKVVLTAYEQILADCAKFHKNAQGKSVSS